MIFQIITNNYNKFKKCATYHNLKSQFLRLWNNHLKNDSLFVNWLTNKDVKYDIDHFAVTQFKTGRFVIWEKPRLIFTVRVELHVSISVHSHCHNRFTKRRRYLLVRTIIAAQISHCVSQAERLLVKRVIYIPATNDPGQLPTRHKYSKMSLPLPPNLIEDLWTTQSSCYHNSGAVHACTPIFSNSF